MRGKKIDSQFLTDFISTCVTGGHMTPNEITNIAQREIDFIDSQIKEVESLKLRRSKLLDVVATFKEPHKVSGKETRILSFFQIRNPQICKFICDSVKNSPCNKETLVCPKYNLHDINFCIKQLLEQQVITKIGETLVRGDCFNEYLRFVLQEG